MSCSAAAGAEAAALLFRSPAPCTIAGRHRLAVSRRTPRRNLRTGVQPHQKSTPSANHRNRASIQRDRAATSIDEEQQQSEDENELLNIQLEDLVGMIQNTQKNILLLNQARLQALGRADKILKEKEALEQKINILEMKLSETGTQSVLSSEVKSDAEGLEFDVVKEENVLLKDDMNFLKAKLIEITETEESLFKLEKERALLDASLRELECTFISAQSDMLKLGPLQQDAWWEKVENLEDLLDSTANQVEHAALTLDGYRDFPDKVEKLKASLGATNVSKFCLYLVDILQQRLKSVEERFQACSHEMHSQIELYEHSIVEFQDTLSKLINESEKKSMEHYAEGMPSEFWSRISLLIDGWSLEKKISINDASMLREMAWKRDNRLREAYLSSRGMEERELIENFLKMALPGTSSGLHIVHIAAEMAPVAKVGGLADVISGLGKALQKKGHLVEIILPKYDCMQHNQINNLKVLDVVVKSYFEGNMFANKIWTGTVEGLPVYFIEPQHPGKFFWRAQYYGEHDDFKRFSYFSRVALELLYQSGKKVDIIHCHDWQTAFVAPLYWDVYANLGFNSARICFTCHNFEYQGVAPAQDLAYCGLDVDHLDRPDRMRDNSHGRINVVKGAIVYSNIVTTVSPTYAQEVRSEGGRGLQDTLKVHSKKFIGILNGIDTDTWNPSTDRFLKVQYSANDLYGKSANKAALRKQLKLSSTHASQPLVGCITRLVPQKGVHLIRHAIYKTAELGGQFVLLGSSPVQHIQREFEGIADQFQNNSNVRLLLKYDDALSHMIFAASDMFIVPSMFEPCGLTQMISMRYGSVPIVRRTGGLNDSVFDFDDETIPMELRNGFTFLKADEQGFDSALERAFNYYHRKPEVWKQLVQKDMKIDFSWDTSASQYEEIYQRAAARARATA
ncbi:probable starch synthase 4, chloroplastic/amyloplastic isoform X2 [Sorghum bicolor]|uniref:probable starch synthase 4, chloroplastic/amyloplastic isoform X2 n=1 Tax=Sorghum bicolor TaxID=4558 RepID=UPI000B425088|nr:probable starch synthase 4, chloroplastic/amyloplastic isoform X2 [Sorghum bicolor]|eukprot:XP_021303377.1 probable starch synthase 4, chloroplastic/amyloplastic isoform X2 [Sorghum bicolor]